TDLSTKLKLLGIDVASFGDAFAERPGARSVVYEDRLRNVYQKLVLSADGERLAGGILVGDGGPSPLLLALMRQQPPVPARPHELLFGAGGPPESAPALGDDAQVCSCNNVTKAEIRRAIAEHALCTVGGVKACTKAGTGCGGCVPLVAQLLEVEL